MANIGHNRSTLWLTRSYNFVDKDPEIDTFRTLFQKQHIRETDLAILAGLAVGTVKNLFGGKTRRPQHVTYGKLAGAMGASYALVQEQRPNYAKEIPKAREQFKEYRTILAKRRERKGGVKKKRNGKGNGHATA